jgi:hypothetical protein
MLVFSGSRQLAFWLSVAALFLAAPALAADTASGSKNFRPPTTVPNYFSNEGGPMIGGSAESRRSELYTSTPAATRAPVASIAAAAPRYRQHVAMVVPRGSAAHDRRRAPTSVHRGAPAPIHRGASASSIHRVAAHGHAPAHVVSRGGSRITHVAHAAGRISAHTASKTTRVTSAHHHARG